jgi:hypothetical protein
VAQAQNLNGFKIDSALDPIGDDPRLRAMLEQVDARLSKSPPPRPA